MAPNPLLQAREIAALDRLFLRAHAAIHTLRQEHPLAGGIHYPKLPAALTESLVAHFAPRLLGRPGRISRGGRQGDLLLHNPDRPAPTIVAVKGTGPARWTTITASDLEAHLLVWVDYTDRIHHRRGPVQIWVLDGPVGDRLTTGRLRLDKALALYPPPHRRAYTIEPRTLRVIRGPNTGPSARRDARLPARPSTGP